MLNPQERGFENHTGKITSCFGNTVLDDDLDPLLHEPSLSAPRNMAARRRLIPRDRQTYDHGERLPAEATAA